MEPVATTRCATEQFQDDISQRLAASKPVVGFDFGILLSAILPSLISVITGCFNKQATTTAVAERLSKGQSDFWLKQKVAIEVRRELKEQGTKMDSKAREALVNSILDSMSSDPGRTVDMVNEIKAQEQFSMV